MAFRSRAAQLALANQDGGAVEEEVGRDPQSRRRAAGTGRNQAFGGGKRFVRVSGWALLELIGRGVTDVEVLAGKARGVLRKQDRELQEALARRWERVYRLLLRQHMDAGTPRGAASWTCGLF